VLVRTDRASARFKDLFPLAKTHRRRYDIMSKTGENIGVDIMTALAEQVFEKAVDLNPIDKAELIEKLFSTFSSNTDTVVEGKWKEEASRRRLAYDKGEIPSDTIENVFDRLAQR
jgi:hypothetical protein